MMEILLDLQNDSKENKVAVNEIKSDISSIKVTLELHESNDDNVKLLRELKQVLELTEIDETSLKKVSFLNLGNLKAIKCIFKQPIYASMMFKNAVKLKGSRYGIQPDFTFHQRTVRKFLSETGKKYVEGKDSIFQVRSWRYLIVKPKDGGETYYESDGSKVVVAKKEWIYPIRQIQAQTTSARYPEGAKAPSSHRGPPRPVITSASQGSA
ncbi:unnamed protein product [Allacma fusca]|uniref:Uncharacterized protein n=1 Tax=Allacma fusca TaxID=39272 RepID=A0A8J2L0X1_9HEXA|nr:unnamed protein product [Allacma fusca]